MGSLHKMCKLPILIVLKITKILRIIQKFHIDLKTVIV